jgi:hypothetical protein
MEEILRLLATGVSKLDLNGKNTVDGWILLLVLFCPGHGGGIQNIALNVLRLFVSRLSLAAFVTHFSSGCVFH